MKVTKKDTKFYSLDQAKLEPRIEGINQQLKAIEEQKK